MTTRQPQTSEGDGERDSFLDALRTVAILRVVVWHTYGTPWISYLVASLPIMFFVAGSLMARSLRRGKPIDVLTRRFRRLLVPLWVMAAAAIAVMAFYSYQTDSAAANLSVSRILWWVFPLWDPRGSDWGVTWWAPLWYLRCLTWLLLASPALVWLWRRFGPAVLVVPLAGLALTEYRLRSGSALPWQFQDAALYSFFWLLGFAYDDGLMSRISRRLSAALCAAFACAAAAWSLTQHVPAGIVNASYPLHLLVALTWLSGALALRLPIAHLALRPRVDSVIYWVNERALTIYLWHTAGLFCMYQLLWVSPHSAVTRHLLALPIVASVTFLAILLFGWVEDIAAKRRPRVWPSRQRAGGKPRPSLRLILPAGSAAAAGFVALLFGLGSITGEPGNVVQPTADTVPASGVGLHIRAQLAEVSPEAPEPVAAPGAVNTSPVAADELQQELQGWQDHWGLAGATVTIQQAGGESWTGAAGVHADGTRFQAGEQYWIGSVTKTFTVALIMRLVEQGAISLDDPVSRFVPEFPNSDLFTVRNLIQHTSGLIAGEETPINATASAAWAGLQFPPGSAFMYSRVGYYLLGLLIEDRMGKSYTRALHDDLLGPLHLDSTLMDEEVQPLKYSTHPFAGLADPDGYLVWSSTGYYRGQPPAVDYRGIHWSSGGLFSTTPDMARWAIDLWGGTDVVSDSSRDAMTTFLDENFDFTGLGTFAFCPCWLDSDRLVAERWGHLGATGAIEYDPGDRVALAMQVSGSVTDQDVVEALDDLSVRLRALVHGRRLVPGPVIQGPRPAQVPTQSPGDNGCPDPGGAITGEAASVGEACTATAELPRPAVSRSCDQIFGTPYTSELERLYFLSECSARFEAAAAAAAAIEAPPLPAEAGEPAPEFSLPPPEPVVVAPFVPETQSTVTSAGQAPGETEGSTGP